MIHLIKVKMSAYPNGFLVAETEGINQWLQMRTIPLLLIAYDIPLSIVVHAFGIQYCVVLPVITRYQENMLRNDIVGISSSLLFFQVQNGFIQSCRNLMVRRRIFFNCIINQEVLTPPDSLFVGFQYGKVVDISL